MKTESDILIEKIQDRLEYLIARWNDEKDHEPWADYVKEIKKLIEGTGRKFVGVPRKGSFSFIWIGKDGRKRETKISGRNIKTLVYP